jgi:hypothetical protein
VVLDMGSTIPFGKSVKYRGGVDEPGDQAYEHDDEDEVAEWPAQTEPSKGENINQIPEHD